MQLWVGHNFVAELLRDSFENWVERNGVRVYGTISDENRAINASGLHIMLLKTCIGSI
jgi:hypothetical protein